MNVFQQMMYNQLTMVQRAFIKDGNFKEACLIESQIKKVNPKHKTSIAILEHKSKVEDAAKRKAEEAKRKAEEAKRKAEEAKRKDEEAKRKDEEAKRKAEEAKRKAEVKKEIDKVIPKIEDSAISSVQELIKNPEETKVVVDKKSDVVKLQTKSASGLLPLIGVLAVGVALYFQGNKK